MIDGEQVLILQSSPVVMDIIFPRMLKQAGINSKTQLNRDEMIK